MYVIAIQKGQGAMADKAIVQHQGLSELARLTQLIEADPQLGSQHTRRQYAANIRGALDWLQGRQLTKTIIEAYAAELQKSGKAPATVNQHLAAVRWLARKGGDMAQDNRRLTKGQREETARRYDRIASVKNVKGQRLQRGRQIEAGELSAIMRTCNDGTKHGARDCALIAVLWACGLRRDEACRLDVGDFKDDGQGGGDLTIRHGKGNKARRVYIFNGALLAVQDWLKVRGGQDGPLFVRGLKGDRLSRGRLAGESIRLIVQRRAEAAGIEAIMPHDFRRSFVSNLLDNGTDLATVSKMAGHASVLTTALYDRRSEETQRKAVRALFVPYKRRAA
jgi:site-specific recombinase XerD